MSERVPDPLAFLTVSEAARVLGVRVYADPAELLSGSQVAAILQEGRR